MKKIFAALTAILSLLVASGTASALTGTMDPAYSGSALGITTNAKSLTSTIGQYFSASFQVNGGTAPYTWQIDPAVPLPPGLVLYVAPDGYTQCVNPTTSASDAQINSCPGTITTGQNVVVSGNPSKVGTYNVKFIVSDSAARKTASTFTFVVQGSDVSNGITVTSPQAGETWQLGSTHTISWIDTTGSSRANNVYISLEPYIPCLYSSTTPCYIVQIAPYTIASNIPSTGSFVWTVPTDLAARYQGSSMRISISTDGGPSGKSGVFAIASNSTVTPVKMGYVDSSSATKVEGWAFDQTSQPTWVKLVYQNYDTPSLTYSQEVGPSINRTDVEQYLRNTFGSTINTQIVQPLGFVANPSNIISIPGKYVIKSATLSQSGTPATLSGLATAPFAVTGQTTSPVTVTGANPINGTVGKGIEAEFRAGGGSNRGFVWTMASGALPPGTFLTAPLVFYACDPIPGQPNMCPDNTERWSLQGTPTTAGTYTFGLKATDSLGNSGITNFTVVVNASSSSGLVLTAQDALSGSVGQTINKRFTVSGGTAPYAWSIVSGSLPTGLNLTFPAFNCITTPCIAPKDEAYISGVTKQAGTFSFSLKVTDSQGRTVTNNYALVITSGQQGEGPISISTPGSGDQWEAGKSYVINWNGNNNLPVNITLDQYMPCLYSEPACKIVQTPGVVIASGVNGTSYNWSIPAGLSGQYRIGIQTVAPGVDYVLWGNSATFTITNSTVVHPKQITVTNPVAGAVWNPDKSYEISWSPVSSGGTVSIYAEKQYVCKTNPCPALAYQAYTITTNAPDTGSFSWQVPSGLVQVSGETRIQVISNSTGQSGESGVFSIAAASTPVSSLKPGDLVVGSTGTVYVITPAAAKYGFTSLQDFISRGYKFNQVRRVEQSVLDAIPTVYTLPRAAGTSFKYEGKAAVYYLGAAQCKEVYPSMATLRAWNVNIRDIVTIPTSEQYPDCNPNYVRLPENTPVRATGDGTVYVIRTGVRYPFANLGAFYRAGFTFRQVVVIPRAELDKYPLGGALE